MERVLDLTLKLADEGLSAEEQEELERLIEAEPLARRRHLQMLEVEAALRSARHAHAADKLLTAPSPSLDDERRVASVLQAIRRPTSLLSWKRGTRVRTAALVAAGTLAAAAAVLIIWRPKPQTGAGQPGAMARMATRPSAARHELPSIPGRRGWSVAVVPVQSASPTQPVRMDLGDGASLEVHGRAVLGIERAAVVADDGVGSRIVLEEGTVAFHRPAADPAQTEFSTPHAEVMVRGGRALVHVSADQTRVDVAEGEAQVVLRTESRPTPVTVRHSATIAGGRAAVTPQPSALFITGRAPVHVPQFVDQAILRRLEDLGFAADLVEEQALRAEHLQNRALVVISPAVSGLMHSRAQELSLHNAHVPILCSRPNLYQDLGMTGPGKSNAEYSNMKTFLSIVDRSHPLAAGFEGEVEVLDASLNMGWGVPAPSAARVAVLRTRDDHAAIFGYDRDAPMLPPATRAPARRVGFFLHPTAVRFSNDNAWHLFDAAVRWAAEE